MVQKSLISNQQPTCSSVEYLGLCKQPVFCKDEVHLSEDYFVILSENCICFLILLLHIVKKTLLLPTFIKVELRR